MPRYRYISAGSNTTVVDGPGQVFAVLAGGADGGSVLLADTAELGLTVNFPDRALFSFASTIASIGPLPATATYHDLHGSSFSEGLSVAATSSANITIVFSE